MHKTLGSAHKIQFCMQSPTKQLPKAPQNPQEPTRASEIRPPPRNINLGRAGGNEWASLNQRRIRCVIPQHLQNIIQMNRGLFSALSALTVVTGTAAFYFWRKMTGGGSELLDRLLIKKILIKLRKRAYSTLRQIAFIVNNIRTLEGDLEVKKISEIFMRDGGSGEKKLHAIEDQVLEEERISQKDFEYSCNQYCQNDIEIKILLETFRKDLSMALEGVIETYQGPMPRLQPEKVLKIQQQIMKRRMDIIFKKYSKGLSNEQCLRLQSQIQEFLSLEGIKDEKEPNEKIFMSVLEHYYRHDADFKDQFEQLELQMEMFMIEMENKGKKATQEDKERIEECKSVEELMGSRKERQNSQDDLQQQSEEQRRSKKMRMMDHI